MKKDWKQAQLFGSRNPTDEEDTQARREREESEPEDGADAEDARENPARKQPADLKALLKGDPELQAQFDRLLGEAMTAARAKWERERGMSADELAGERMSERERGLEQRERALGQRELRAQAMEALGDKGLPPELADCLSLESEETMNATLLRAEKALRQSVDAMLNERMRGAPPKGAGADDALLSAMRRAAGLR